MTKSTGFLARLRRFGRARSGLAALEFALISPMMVFLLFGSVELIDALGANRCAENVAASISDVVARDNSVSNSEITGLWSAVTVLMYPNDGSTTDLRVTSVMINSATDARVVWSEVHNGFTARQANSSVTLPSAMMIPGSSLIMTESIYHYTPPLHFLFSANVAIQHTAYRRSRLVDPIPRCNC